MSLRSGFLSLSILAAAVAMLYYPQVVEAGPQADASQSSVNVPIESALQTLRTLEERIWPKNSAGDDHGTAQPATAAKPIPPVKKTPQLGAVYVDLVQHVAVRKPVNPQSRRGALASRSGEAFVTVRERRVMPVDISPLILKNAEQYRIDPFLIKAVIFAESNFRNSATSPCGAAGLMQLMPGTGHMMGARDLYQPSQNVAAGAKYLRYLLDMYDGNLTAAIAAYNAGPGNVPKSGAVPNISETRNYVKKVLKAYKDYKNEATKG